ncbi:MAG: UDP-2,3-diacylglucosamine diphosphatase [Gemmatimonadetes bacterium]|nr:UDP-2,3-diacylglucosamine diphosphatase [Gemmatimonadota bacterium]
MLPTPCWLTSDIHIGAVPAEVEHALLTWLRAARAQARSVVLNGDVFDYWFEWRHVMPRHGYRIVAAIADLVEAGIPVIWLGGNHDAWGGELLRRDVGVEFRLEPWRGAIGGWQAHIEHGDGLRQVEDRTYRVLRAVLRNPLAIWTFRWIHPDLSSRLALGSSATSRHLSAAPKGDGLRRIALERLAADPATTLVVFGHTHTRELVRAPGGGVYANCGGWYEQGPAFVRITDDAVELRAWAGSGEGECLDAVERLAKEALRLA